MRERLPQRSGDICLHLGSGGPRGFGPDGLEPLQLGHEVVEGRGQVPARLAVVVGHLDGGGVPPIQQQRRLLAPVQTCSQLNAGSSCGYNNASHTNKAMAH